MRVQSLLSLSLACVLGSLSAQQVDDTKPAPGAAEVQQKVREWVRVRQLIAEESALWEAEKEQLAALNELRTREAAQLDEYIAAAGRRVKEADEERQHLIKEESTLRELRSSSEQKVAELETQLRQQTGDYPPPLRNAVSDAIARLDKSDASTPLQNRWRDVLAILSEAAQFKNKLTIDTEIREIDGQRVEVDVLYLGLSQAWYVDRAKKRGGTGIPAAGGWQWTENNSIAGKIGTAIEIARKKSAPDFITLPFSGAAN